MKKNILLGVLLFLSSLTFSQITITQNDVIDVGDYIITKEDTMPLPAINPGSAGINQTWDFSTLQQHNIDTLGFDLPSTTTYYSYFPNANICGKDTTGGGYYIQKNAQCLTIEGFAGTVDLQGVPTQVIAPFQPADTIIKFPLNYLDWGHGGHVEIDQIEYVGMNIGGFMIDSAHVKTSKKKSFVVDAWGNLTTPIGTYSVLRQNTQEIEIDSIWILPQLTQTWTLYQATADTFKMYSWFAHNMGLQLVEMEWDEASSAAVTVSWLSETNHNSIFETKPMNLEVYPNPTSSMLFVNFKENSSGTIRIYDVKGSLLLIDNIFNEKAKVVDVTSLVKGMYIVEFVTDENVVYTNKVVKK
jgi:Secretion system C-terminal sorting domain